MAHDPELDEVFDKFEAETWNAERTKLEDEVISSTLRLSNFMGSNSFTLSSGLMRIKVLVISGQLNAMLNRQ
jgi:uncharacterized protein YdeI (YjbR/CyaY-like superfamily)